jgi:hypothetical protein
MNGFANRVEDLEVFRRAYRLSLEVHRAKGSVGSSSQNRSSAVF